MRKNQLPKSEVEICNRMRWVREEVLFLTQAECARRTGIDRATWVNYELGRTPLRYEIGLRLCRGLILSEEWLATGRCEACHHAGVQEHGFKKDSDWRLMDEKVFVRQCVDLFSEPGSLHIRPGTLFSEAYEKTLAPKYQELVSIYFHYPRICFVDFDIPELAVELLKVVNERHIAMLMNEAKRKNVNPALVWRQFTRSLLDVGDMTFRKFMGSELNEEDLKNLAWVQRALSDPRAVIGPFSAGKSQAASGGQSRREKEMAP